MCHPIETNRLPPRKDANATLPNIIKSVTPWTIDFSLGFVLFAIISLPPTNKKFHPSPHKNNDNQKWYSVWPIVPK